MYEKYTDCPKISFRNHFDGNDIITIVQTTGKEFGDDMNSLFTNRTFMSNERPRIRNWNISYFKNPFFPSGGCLRFFSLLKL